MEVVTAKRTPVGELVAHYLMGNKPAYEDASQEADNRQEYLTCDKVEPVEERTAEEYQTMADGSQRQ